MTRSTTPSFVCELPLVLVGADERHLQIRLDAARQVYNATLGESLRRLKLLRESKEYARARVLPHRTKAERTARAIAFRQLDIRFRLREYDLHAYATQFGRCWIGQHLDANTIQTVTTRAWNAVRQYQLGVRGRPRFRGKGQFDSVEGKTNRQGIRWRNGQVRWGDDHHQAALSLRARIPVDDPVVTHALACPIKFVRIVRRTLNGRIRFFVQLVCAGTPYQKSSPPVEPGVIGLDPGPRTFGMAGANWGAQVDLITPLAQSRRKRRQLQRQIDRQRRANNPGNYLRDGQVKPGRKRWHISQHQRDNERKLAESQRKEAAHRKTLHGQLVNALLGLGNDFRIEKNSYRSFQKIYGKAVGQAAPAAFRTLLIRKAASANGRATEIPTSLKLSQTCLCGVLARKPLSERVHRCDCGITVQRDVFSAWLARFCTAWDGPAGPSWRLDADQARAAWSGAEQRLPMASSPVSVQAFVAWARQQSAKRRLDQEPCLSPSGGGTERIVGTGVTRSRKALDDVVQSSSTNDAQEPASARRGDSQTSRL